LAKGIQGFKDLKIRRFKDSVGSWQRAVGKGNSKIQRFKDSRIRGLVGSKQWAVGSQLIKGFCAELVIHSVCFI